MKYLPPNPHRGLIGLGGLFLATGGAGILWGLGGAFFICGLLIYLDAATDDFVERSTGMTRWPPQETDRVRAP
jgi:hypothetical protein